MSKIQKSPKNRSKKDGEEFCGAETTDFSVLVLISLSRIL